MAVPVQIPAKASTANGITTVFPYDFLILDEADMLVTGTLEGVVTTYVLDVDYTVDGVGDASGGNVTFISGAPASDTVVLRKRNMAFKREVDYQANGDLIASEVNADIDNLAMQLQQVAEEGDRAIKLPAHLVGISGTLPTPSAGRVLVWNTDETGIENGDTDLSGDLLLRGELASEVDSDAKGAALVMYVAPGSDAPRTSREKLSDRVDVRDFGATGVSSQDATAAFEAAIDALPESGGTIFVDPDGVYKLTAMVQYSKPILWKCERGNSDISTNTNGGDLERPVVYYGGVAPIEALLKMSPPAANTAVWGGGVEGLNFDGFNKAEYAIHFDNCRYSTISGRARNCTVAGALISSLSGTVGVFSKKVHVKDWEYVYGTEVAAANSHGIRIIGNGSTVPATQHKVDRVFALIKHGAAVCVEETDNCQFDSLQAVGDSGSGGGGGAATGCTILFRNVGSTVAYNNRVNYCAGEFRQENGCFGNIVEHLTSEGGGIGQVSGTSVWHGSLTNYTGGSERYRSHEFKLRKKIEIRGGDFLGQTGNGLLAAKWVCPILREAGNDTVTVTIPIDSELTAGNIEGIELFIGANAGVAGNLRLLTELSTFQINTGVSAPEKAITETVAAPSANQVKSHSVALGGSLSYAKGDIIMLSITRTPADALDTCASDVFVFGARILYASTGPAGATALYLPTWGAP